MDALHAPDYLLAAVATLPKKAIGRRKVPENRKGMRFLTFLRNLKTLTLNFPRIRNGTSGRRLIVPHTCALTTPRIHTVSIVKEAT